MRWLLVIVLFAQPAWATNYFMSPTGSDAANGLTTGTAWSTPNHSGLNCGDTISAAAGSYGQMTITSQPTCAKHDAVWVSCVTFDACKIAVATGGSQGAIDVQASNWAFLGWEATTTGDQFTACFAVIPSGTATVGLHDDYFINDVANGCQAGGFNADNANGVSVDYIVDIADIAYNAAQSSAFCYSGFNVLQPIAYDTLPGTHIYMSQVFAWDNLEPATCDGTNSTDGEGIILDTFNGYYVGGPPYAQQAVIDNAITVYNGAMGVLEGGAGNSSSHVYIKRVTAYGNFINTNQNQPNCGQIESYGFPPTSHANINRFTEILQSLAVPGANTLAGCGSNPAYAYFMANVDQTSVVYGNAGYSAGGFNTGSSGTTTGFSFGPNNTFTTNPVLANPVQPGAPSCSGTTSVIACMATVIANFKPTVNALKAYGYQPPSSASAFDSLFPQWLCNNPNMPTGLVTMGCVAGSSTSQSVSSGRVLR